MHGYWLFWYDIMTCDKLCILWWDFEWFDIDIAIWYYDVVIELVNILWWYENELIIYCKCKCIVMMNECKKI